MSNLVYLECLIRGHNYACEQDAVLLPEGGGVLEHRHRCIRCAEAFDLGDEDLPPEVESMLRMTLPPTDRRVIVSLAEPHTHQFVH